MKIKIALIICLITSIAIHTYLTQHFHSVQLGGDTADSICNSLGTSGCDTVAASNYSSLWGLPLAAYGAALHAILLLWSIGLVLGLIGDPATSLFLFGLSLGFVGMTSVVMAGISTFVIQSICMFCGLAYALSFAQILLWWAWPNRKQLTAQRASVAQIFSRHKAYILVPVGSILIAVLMNRSFTGNLTPQKLDQLVKRSLIEWEQAPTLEFDSAPLLSKGAPANGVMTIQEFADFRCGHCRVAAGHLKAFLKTRSGVKLDFFAWPLDGSCNQKIPSQNGLGCLLAEAVACANDQNMGWEAHDLIFKNQNQLNQARDVKTLKVESFKVFEAAGLDTKQLESCLDDHTHLDVIKKHAEIGDRAGIQGTPTIFVNNKALSRGQFLPVLDAVYNSLRR